MVKMSVYQCMNEDCGIIFAIEEDASDFSLNSPLCPVCGDDTTVELAETEVDWEAKAE